MLRGSGLDSLTHGLGLSQGSQGRGADWFMSLSLGLAQDWQIAVTHFPPLPPAKLRTAEKRGCGVASLRSQG